MNLEKLSIVLRDQPAYRFKQAQQAIFRDFIDDWQKVTVLPVSLRVELNQQCPLGINGQLTESASQDTAKAVVVFDDGAKVETVLLKHQDGRRTVCVSSQVGCPLACTFCATGQMGFKRDLMAEEIVEQLLFFGRQLKINNERISNVVFMGMGEPFLNYDQVIKAIRIINDPDGLNVGIRHVSISTVGITSGINKLARENLQVNLAISLHAPDEVLRTKLVPANRKYPIKAILPAVDQYIKKTRRRVMFEYLLIRGVNDSANHAQKLAKLMNRPLCFVNLITYNATGLYQTSTAQATQNFKRVLERAGVAVTQRHRFGRDLKAACGQLATD